MRTSTRMVVVLFPLLALAWFGLSLNSRIDSGWEYISHPKQWEFVCFKYGIAALLVVPAFMLVMEDDRGFMRLAGIWPGMICLKESVTLWMISLIKFQSPETPRLPYGAQFAICATFMLFGLIFAYGPWIVSQVIRRRRLVVSDFDGS